VFIKRILKTRARDLLERWKLGGPLTQSSPVYEFHMLCLAQERGIRVPTPVAAGERRSIGFAREGFLVVKALTGISLLELLQQNAARDGNKKRRIAHYVGAAVARLHAAGLSFPSLFSKHVYFDSQCEEPIGFLDLADATDHGKLPPPRLRYEDLSALGATLPRSDVNHGLRLLALRSYLKELGRAESEWRNMWNRIAGGVKSQAKRKRHRLFSSRHPVPLPIVHQNADGSEVRHEALPLIAAFASNVYPTDEGARLPAGFESKRERRSVAMKHWRTLLMLRQFRVPIPEPMAVLPDGEFAVLILRTQSPAADASPQAHAIANTLNNLLGAGCSPIASILPHLRASSDGDVLATFSILNAIQRPAKWTAMWEFRARRRLRREVASSELSGEDRRAILKQL
jgi:hypothetical protein